MAFSVHAFEERYKKLNKSQREAVDAIEGPVMVIAGPGTGKTTILTLRIANILRRTDTPAHGILAITYTNAGVKAMRAKLHDIIGSRAHEVAIHTFHSFATAMIAEYPDHFVSIHDFTNMTDVEQEFLIRTIITDTMFKDLRPMGKPDYYIAAIVHGIEDAKRDALTPDMVKQYAQDEIHRIKNDEASISTRGASKGKLKAEANDAIEKCEKTILFAEVYRRYEEEKQKNKRLDFNDLIIEILKAMQRDELFLRLIQERFLYILVDEHQDTNDAQNLIIKAIAEFFDKPNVFIVGDEKQAVYRFQGASVENFLALQKRWPGMNVISLDTNYRSHQTLLDASFSMIEHNYEGEEHRALRVELSSGSDEKERRIAVITGENTAALERRLIEELRTISKKEPTATIAIITRRNREVERIIHLLEAHAIPVSSERSIDIFHHPVGTLYFDLLAFIADPSRIDSLAKTIAGGLWDITMDDSIKLIKELRSDKIEHLEKKIPALSHARRELLDDGAVAYIINIAELSGFTRLISRDPSYIHVWRGIVSLAESITREGQIQNPHELIQAMLAYRQSAESKTVKVSVGAPDLPISAMTAHGSKGLEFDYVFMPYANEESWIGRPRGSSFVLPKKRVDDHDIRDTRRLFYVALTRAKKHCVVLTSLEESDGKALTPLRFISELDPKYIAEEILPRATLETSGIGKEEGAGHTNNTTRSLKMLSFIKETLINNGVSVTALNHFLECPNKFIYQSILKLPQAPTASAEKGSAMHEAISHVWRLERKTVETIQATLIEGMQTYLNESFLATRDKESVKNELIEIAPIVAQALLSHFSQQGTIATERWVKTTFEGMYDSTRITIPIHGKLDAILEQGDSVAVYDYKTRQAMSINAIKGATKSDTGDYFRQLVFYKILLSDDPRLRTKQINPALVFVSPDEKGRCPVISLPIENTDIEQVKAHIQKLIESVWSGTIVKGSCQETDCEWCGLAKIGISI
jgi:DNA helicase II / ATP-dependent DNA helicase PcrA